MKFLLYTFVALWMVVLMLTGCGEAGPSIAERQGAVSTVQQCYGVNCQTRPDTQVWGAPAGTGWNVTIGYFNGVLGTQLYLDDWYVPTFTHDNLSGAAEFCAWNPSAGRPYMGAANSWCGIIPTGITIADLGQPGAQWYQAPESNYPWQLSSMWLGSRVQVYLCQGPNFTMQCTTFGFNGDYPSMNQDDVRAFTQDANGHPWPHMSLRTIAQ